MDEKSANSGLFWERIACAALAAIVALIGIIYYDLRDDRKATRDNGQKTADTLGNLTTKVEAGFAALAVEMRSINEKLGALQPPGQQP